MSPESMYGNYIGLDGYKQHLDIRWKGNSDRLNFPREPPALVPAMVSAWKNLRRVDLPICISCKHSVRLCMRPKFQTNGLYCAYQHCATFFYREDPSVSRRLVTSAEQCNVFKASRWTIALRVNSANLKRVKIRIWFVKWNNCCKCGHFGRHFIFFLNTSTISIQQFYLLELVQGLSVVLNLRSVIHINDRVKVKKNRNSWIPIESIAKWVSLFRTIVL